MQLEKNVVSWFEIYVLDMDRAKKFYGTVLGVEFTDVPDPEGSNGISMAFFPGAPDGPNACGALVKMDGVKQSGAATISTMVYFDTEDCQAEESRVVSAGGQVHKPKFSIGEFGFCSICMDTEGNTFGLHSLK
ncbi:MAG: VOC family protein [Bacteroidetes bacterium]|nr:VOC family protein [Bacteroidota bacterium]